MPLNLENYQPETAFVSLGEQFSDTVDPAIFPKTILRWRNNEAATRIGLESLLETDWLNYLGRFQPFPGENGMQAPVAMRYHGHQFQTYNPDIGDGRGFLYAQCREQATGKLLDLGTKGSGQTPYSRFGDGRLTLKGGVREVLAAELLEALGVNTSQALSLVETGEELQRNDEPSPTRSAVLVRLQHSHIRFGTFQRHAFERAPERLEALVDHCLTYYFPDLFGSVTTVSTEDKVIAFLKRVTQNSARLVAQWMIAGFVHGVLNTDNMVVTGQSFDYGPYRFLPEFEPGFTAAYFDKSGLYAYGRQPDAVAWNLSRLAGCFLQLGLDSEQLSPALAEFGPEFQRALAKQFFWRIGRAQPEDKQQTEELIASAFAAMRDTKMAPDRFFHLAGTVEGAAKLPDELSALKAQLTSMPSRLEGHLTGEPCSLLYDEIEAIWSAIDERDDWNDFQLKVANIRNLSKTLHLGST